MILIHIECMCISLMPSYQDFPRSARAKAAPDAAILHFPVCLGRMDA
jgi:hypothetical protein